MRLTILITVEHSAEPMEVIVRASFLEIYMEQVRDLLKNSTPHLDLRSTKEKGLVCFPILTDRQTNVAAAYSLFAVYSLVMQPKSM
jgi:hypothetical protein